LQSQERSLAQSVQRLTKVSRSRARTSILTINNSMTVMASSSTTCAFVIGSALALAASTAFAGPPFQTDDPEPVDLHHYELYVGSQQTLTSNGRSGTMPHLEFNYGALPNMQLHIVVPYAFNRQAGGSTQRGVGDTELGVKYRFVQETDTMPSIGVFPLYEAPTGNSDRGLGNGAYQLYLPVWLQKSWGKWTTYGGGGYWINHATDGRNNWFFGWLLQRELSEHLTLGAEVFHRTEQLKGQGASSGFNVGGSYNIDEHKHILFSAGRGLQNASATNKFSSYIAYQLTY
jgi:hypothetical protein